MRVKSLDLAKLSEADATAGQRPDETARTAGAGSGSSILDFAADNAGAKLERSAKAFDKAYASLEMDDGVGADPGARAVERNAGGTRAVPDRHQGLAGPRMVSAYDICAGLYTDTA